VIEDADGVGEVGNPLCGDMMTCRIEHDHRNCQGQKPGRRQAAHQ
jgi:NifU-like protein involved in Fe-S cluster formation